MSNHMSATAFTIYYDGPALDDGSMDVRELAPALLAFGEMLEHANRVVNGSSVSVSVRVKGFKGGSFGISFETVMDLMTQFKGMFKPGESFRDALEILSLLGISPTGTVAACGGGLFWLIKKARGRAPKKSTVLESGNVSISFEDEVVEAPKLVAELYADPDLRASLDRAVEPLRMHGITSVYVMDGETKRELVNAAEAPYFPPREVETSVQLPDVDPTPQVRYFSIVALSFKEDNKWKLTDGSSTLFVTITHKQFLDEVSSGVRSFSKGDTLKVLLVTRQMQTGKGLVTEYEAVEILDHTRFGRQLLLPI